MMTIYKYQVPVESEFDLTLPKGAKVLSVQTQANAPCIWCLVNNEARMEPRRFRMLGTGHPFDDYVGPEYKDAHIFIGTFQMHGGALVFHLFEVGK